MLNMSCICASEEWIAVPRGSKSCIFNVKSDKQITLELPPPQPPVKQIKTASLTAADESSNFVQGLQFSPCGKWFSVYTSSKQLVLWETDGFTLVSERIMPKAASSMKFTPDSKSVVIVDKAGDAILYSVLDSKCEGTVILGHLSMLLDVVLSPSGNQIITCDRDEKIRVSKFPNAYNIISYCLGHKEFVSSLCLLPHNPSVLLSSSGDGTMQLWEYLSGKPLTSYDCSSDAIKELTEDSSVVPKEKGESNFVIVRKIVCLGSNADSSIACALVYGYQGFLVYLVVGQSIKFIRAVCVHEVIMDICFTSSGELLVHSAKSNDLIQCFSFNHDFSDSSSISVGASQSENVKKINCLLNSMDFQQTKSVNVPQLLKRKFDNVKDYYEQKKARIGQDQA